MALQGKTVLITGSTDGLGRMVAEMAAAAGARVLLHGRSAEKGEAARGAIAEATGNPDIEVFRADLGALDEVRALAQAVTARHGRLDVLVNNAGVGLFGQDQGRETSREGHELHFAVNYLAPFLLTRLLLDELKAAAPARIVNVASVGQAPIDFDDVMIERDYSGRRAYSQSKLAQIMFTLSLADRLKGAGVTVTALHPATFMATNMVTGLGMAPMSTIRDGAEPTFRLIASDEVEGETGLYYNQFNPARANDQAYDAAARERLWALSSALVGLPAD